MKRTFVLLELIIALILCGLCLVPLIEIPVRALKKEYQTSTLLSLENASDLTFADIKAKLYLEQIPWKLLEASRKEKALLSSQEVKIGTETFLQKCYLFCSSAKEGKDGKEKRLITVEVEFTHPKSSFFLIKKQPAPSKSFQYKVFVTTDRPFTSSLDLLRN